MLNFAYVAGFFDADGSVGVYIDNSRRPTNQNPRFNLRTNICNQNKQLLECFSSLWGGGVYRQPRAWVWTMSSNLALLFLRDILPYLVHKRDQVELAIKWQENKHPTHYNRPSPLEDNLLVSNQLKAMKRKHKVC